MAEAVAKFSFRLPAGLIGAPQSTLKDVARGDVVLCGYFCDNLAGGPPGARFLARQVRYASEGDTPLAGVHDLGDLNVFPLEPDKHAAAVAEQLSLITKAGAVPIFVGGDRSGADILARQAGFLQQTEITIHDVARGAVAPAKPTALIIAEVDLSAVRGTGQRPEAITAAIEALPERVIAGAVFGLAPMLDWSGAVEARVACMWVRALAQRLARGHCDAAA